VGQGLPPGQRISHTVYQFTRQLPGGTGEQLFGDGFGSQERAHAGQLRSDRIITSERRALTELAVTIERTAMIVAQARTRLAGQMPDGATRLVSLHDPDARPIRKGRIDRHVEFGYKAQVTDNDDGIVLDYAVEGGAAPDGPQLVPAIKRVTRRTGRVPRAVTADRGYGQAAVERDLHELGVRTVAIPRQATTSPARKAIEHSRGFRKLVKWRTGCEGRISYLKRGYGWNRTLLDGKNGAAIWCGHGVLAHNLVKISALAG
jgi:IS5 family transposase